MELPWRESLLPLLSCCSALELTFCTQDYIRDHRAEYTATGVSRVLAGPGLEEIVQILADYHLTLRLRGLLEGVEIDAED